MSDLPLSGRRILITRTQEGSATLARNLAELGATAIEIPLIRIVPPESYEALDQALARLADYDMLLVTSANTARVITERKTPPWSCQPFTAVIGPATAQAVRSAGLRVDMQPTPSIAESLLQTLAPGCSGKRILLPRARVAREMLPDGLRAEGAIVDVVEAYRTVPDTASRALLAKLFAGSDGANASNSVDGITFTSASTVQSFFSLLGEARGHAVLRVCRGFSIGPVTTAALRAHGARPCREAESHDLEGLIAALCREFAG